MPVELADIGSVRWFSAHSFYLMKSPPPRVKGTGAVCVSVAGTFLGDEGSYRVDAPTKSPSGVIQPRKATGK